ncbi:MAG: hypothetical protein AAGI07_14160, partial [Bacteroidota bacterium]
MKDGKIKFMDENSLMNNFDILNLSPIPTILLNESLVIVYTNNSARTLYKYEHSLFGVAYSELLNTDITHLTIAEIFTIEKHKKADDTTLYVGVKYNEIEIEGQVHYILQINDISAVKKHQNKINDLIAETH